MYLERWIGNRTGGLDIGGFQLSRIQCTVDYAYRESAFYRDSFNCAGIKPNDICCLSDLSLLPFVTAKDLRDEPYRMLCVSLSGIKRVFTLYTGGTSGAPKKVFFSAADFDGITDYMGAAMRSVAMSGGIVEEAFKAYLLIPDGKPESQQKTLAKGIERVGGVPILGDLALGIDDQIERIARSRPDILFGPVSRIYKMSLKAKETTDLRQLGVQVIFTTSEYMPLSMRRGLEDIWNAEVFTHYGMTEMGWAGGIECRAHGGFHFNEVDILIEVIDPASGLSAGDGEEGELVLTTINREAMPLIRYRTGDMGRLFGGSCGCGAIGLRRLGPLMRRMDSIVMLAGGDEIYTSLFDDAVYTVPDVTDYQVFLVRKDGRERLVFRIELLRERAVAETEVAQAIMGIPQIAASIASGSMASLRIELVEQGVLKSRGRSKRLILDGATEGLSW